MDDAAKVVEKPEGMKKADPRVVAALSQQLGIAEGEIHGIYTQEYARIAAQARITSYVPVLALHNTYERLSRRSRVASPR
jgi:hypothetical protein